jgi:hypothetical protein
VKESLERRQTATVPLLSFCLTAAMWLPSGVATNCVRIPAVLLVSNLDVFVAILNFYRRIEPPTKASPVLVTAEISGDSKPVLGGAVGVLCDGSSRIENR